MVKSGRPTVKTQVRAPKANAARTVDLFKQYKVELAAPRKPLLVNIGSGSYLAVKGTGEPGSEAFQAAIQALYSMAWTLKMNRKFSGRDDFKVTALEGVYRDRCDWTLLIRVPPFVTKSELKKTAAELVKKGKGAGAENVELIRMREGNCSQVLQVGPYDTVCRTVDELRAFESANGLACSGPLHEIYLSDPRRVAPEKIRTIIRRPVAKA